MLFLKALQKIFAFEKKFESRQKMDWIKKINIKEPPTFSRFSAFAVDYYNENYHKDEDENNMSAPFRGLLGADMFFHIILLTLF